jgi:hypothetical protein
MAIGINRRYPTAGSPLLVCQSDRTSRGSGGFGGKGSGGGAGAGFGDGGIGFGFGLGPGGCGFGIGAELITMIIPPLRQQTKGNNFSHRPESDPHLSPLPEAEANGIQQLRAATTSRAFKSSSNH